MFDNTYESAEDAWSAALHDNSKVIAGEFLFEDEAGSLLQPGDTVRLIDPDSRRSREVVVVGVFANDFVWNGVMTGVAGARDIVGDLGQPRRFYVNTENPLDATTVAGAINGELLTSGVDARAFQVEVDEELASQQGFIRILQVYLGLGLLVGVAGLGIVMVRAVRERRREIAMLRAMGYHAQTVRHAFLVESLFVAGQGSLLGVGLGVLSAWQVVTKADAFGAGSPGFVVPTLVLVGLAVGPVIAALLTTVGPANRAAAIDPAIALRVTG